MAVSRQLSQEVAGASRRGAPPGGQEQQDRTADPGDLTEATSNARPKDEEAREMPASNGVRGDLAGRQERDLAARRREGCDRIAAQQTGRDLARREELNRRQGRWGRA
jgi:hypothetical protein